MNERIYDVASTCIKSDHCLRNVFMFDWESDIFLITRSQISIEIEVKTSRSDFFADFKKPKHELFKKSNKKYVFEKTKGLQSNNCTSIRHMLTGECIPNRFYYAVPEGMISLDEVPEYAGLMHIPEKGKPIYDVILKKAPLLHRYKKDWQQKLIDKYYWRVKGALNEIEQISWQEDRMGKEDKESFYKNKITRIRSILK